MRFKYFLLSLMLFCGGSLFAQGASLDVGDKELRFTISDGSFGGAGQGGPQSSADIANRSEANRFIVFNFGYRKQLSESTRFGADLGFTSAKSNLKVVDQTTSGVFKESDLYFIVLPSAEFTFAKERGIEFYGGVGLGARFCVASFDRVKGPETIAAPDNAVKVSVAWQANLFGIRYSWERLTGFASMGIGTQGLLSFGVARKF